MFQATQLVSATLLTSFLKAPFFLQCVTPGPHRKHSFQTGTRTCTSLAAPPGSPAKRPTRHLFMLYYYHFNPIAPLLMDKLIVSWVHNTQKMHLIKKNNKVAALSVLLKCLS